MSDEQTQNIYDAKAQDYAKLTTNELDNPDLAAFVQSLPSGAHVLDLGCGPGHSAGFMARAGFRVDALDASLEMIKLASVHSGVTARQATFDELDAEALYDGVYANFSLLHAERNAVSGHIIQIARALKSGGIFHIAMKTGNGETRDGIGRRYSYFTEIELEQMMTDNALTVIRRTHGADAGLSGEVADWVVLQSRKTQ